ncbi:MAG: efflux RND transporter periplasmic adaptor subunit [Gemmatimonadota bacterium]|jgi:HlyD family secretion protein
MKLSRKLLGYLSLVIIIGLLAAGVYYRLRPEPEATEASEATSSETALPASASQQFATDVPQPVVGAEVVRDTLWITVTAAGQAEAIRRAAVLSRVDGVLEEILVGENALVEEGGLLIRFDTTEYSLAADRARASLVDAEARYLEMTFGDEEITDPVAREERDHLARARSGLAQAEVALREAEINLERTSVRAPFPGRIANLRVVEGQFASPGTELLTVVDLDPIKVEVQVLEAEIGYLREGRRATVTFAAFPGESFSGRISTINPVVDPDTRTARVTVLLSNPQGRIKPGMYARVSLEANYFPDRILVPRSAILEKDRRTMLFVYEDGRAKWRYVTTGMENDTQVEIVPNEETSMVEPGEIVLVDNHYYIIHDAPVTLVESVSPSAQGVAR